MRSVPPSSMFMEDTDADREEEEGNFVVFDSFRRRPSVLLTMEEEDDDDEEEEEPSSQMLIRPTEVNGGLLSHEEQHTVVPSLGETSLGRLRKMRHERNLEVVTKFAQMLTDHARWSTVRNFSATEAPNPDQTNEGDEITLIFSPKQSGVLLTEEPETAILIQPTELDGGLSPQKSSVIRAFLDLDLASANAETIPQRKRRMRQERNLEIAKKFAHDYAYSDPEKGAPRKDGKQSRETPPSVQSESPYLIARKIVDERVAQCKVGHNKPKLMNPTPESAFGTLNRPCPSLFELCLPVVAKYAENVVTLVGLPDFIKCQISDAVCKARTMNSAVLPLFFDGKPFRIHIRDCSQISEEELIVVMRQPDMFSLEASSLMHFINSDFAALDDRSESQHMYIYLDAQELYLGNCGRAMTEKCILSTIAAHPSQVFALKSLTLDGAYLLSDNALANVLEVSPLLTHLKLSSCRSLTNLALEIIAEKCDHSLESLELDWCQQLDAGASVRHLRKLRKLKKLSLAHVGGVTDAAVIELCKSLGPHLKGLSLTNCSCITDAAIAQIGIACPSLETLNLAFLTALTDAAISHITDNLRSLSDIDLRRCKMSDEAIAAFVTASGALLTNFSVNNVEKAGDQTCIALAQCSRESLERLDISFCRRMSDECVGHLVDKCAKLCELRLFGCTQVSEAFCGYERSKLKVLR